MKKFEANVNRELSRAYPDRRRLETQCLSSIAFVKSESDTLDCPIWILIVNVVAMDMLKTKLPPGEFVNEPHKSIFYIWPFMARFNSDDAPVISELSFSFGLGYLIFNRHDI